MRNNNIYKIYIGAVVITCTILITLGALNMLYHKDQAKNNYSESQIHSCMDIKIVEATKVSINGDTTRRLYMVNDTVTGILWIGIGGRVSAK